MIASMIEMPRPPSYDGLARGVASLGEAAAAVADLDPDAAVAALEGNEDPAALARRAVLHRVGERLGGCEHQLIGGLAVEFELGRRFTHEVARLGCALGRCW